jgi:AcrR family transcriptional regulator
MVTTTGQVGRPRSEQARDAVLHAVDDLLLEVGYAAMTMKGIAERAGVGRQTVYRWWSHKAEILLEASVADAQEELAVPATGSALNDLTAYLQALVTFLTRSPAGVAYRALIAAAQHDTAVATLIATSDVLGASSRAVLTRMTGEGTHVGDLDRASALLVGPVFYWVMSGRDPLRLQAADLAQEFLRAVAVDQG